MPLLIVAVQARTWTLSDAVPHRERLDEGDHIRAATFARTKCGAQCSKSH